MLKWDQFSNKRAMPWKGERDPYKIWLSEIILQQTRVEQGTAYYNNFIKAFPGIRQLAAAPEQAVYKLWEGLGYYSRCRNMIATARFITEERNGVFPQTYEEVLQLKGIGPYTASAIVSFAYNLPHAVVDGNVMRVLSRVFGISTPIDSTDGKKIFSALADQLLDKKRPAAYNQAIMDFGATVCKPAAPLCDTCILQPHCVAFQDGRIQALPVKSKKLLIKERFFYFLVVSSRGRTAIRQRTGKDIWQNLYEFPLIEMTGAQMEKEALQLAIEKGWVVAADEKAMQYSISYQQKLTHQKINAVFISVQLSKPPPGLRAYEWVNPAELSGFSFPKIINDYLPGLPG